MCACVSVPCVGVHRHRGFVPRRAEGGENMASYRPKDISIQESLSEGTFYVTAVSFSLSFAMKRRWRKKKEKKKKAFALPPYFFCV